MYFKNSKALDTQIHFRKSHLTAFFMSCGLGGAKKTWGWFIFAPLTLAVIKFILKSYLSIFEDVEGRETPLTLFIEPVKFRVVR